MGKHRDTVFIRIDDKTVYMDGSSPVYGSTIEKEGLERYHRYTRPSREELIKALERVVYWNAVRGGIKDEILPADQQEDEIANAMELLSKVASNSE